MRTPCRRTGSVTCACGHGMGVRGWLQEARRGPGGRLRASASYDVHGVNRQ